MSRFEVQEVAMSTPDEIRHTIDHLGDGDDGNKSLSEEQK